MCSNCQLCPHDAVAKGYNGSEVKTELLCICVKGSVRLHTQFIKKQGKEQGTAQQASRRSAATS